VAPGVVKHASEREEVVILVLAKNARALAMKVILRPATFSSLRRKKPHAYVITSLVQNKY
jgi:hypothetical protein